MQLNGCLCALGWMVGSSGIPCPTGFLWHKEQEHNKQFVGWSPLSCCCFLDSIPVSLFEFLVFLYFLLLWRTMLLCVRVGSRWAMELVWFPPLRWAGKLANSIFKSLANCSLNPLGLLWVGGRGWTGRSYISHSQTSVDHWPFQPCFLGDLFSPLSSYREGMALINHLQSQTLAFWLCNIQLWLPIRKTKALFLKLSRESLSLTSNKSMPLH